MTFQDICLVLFIVFFIITLASFIYKAIKNGGFHAGMFGAPILRTMGEVKATEVRIMNLVLKVHKLDGDSSNKSVGLEFVNKSFLQFQIVPLALSVTETKKLIQLLETAVRGK